MERWRGQAPGLSQVRLGVQCAAASRKTGESQAHRTGSRIESSGKQHSATERFIPENCPDVRQCASWEATDVSGHRVRGPMLGELLLNPSVLAVTHFLLMVAAALTLSNCCPVA